MLGERRAAILNLIIDSYIKTGEPIGSKTLSNLLPYKISSATIRNEMSFLSELGFLEQMHTSGGRIPSKASYRYYVDNLMAESPLSPAEEEKIRQFLSVNAGDPERLLRDAAQLLAETTNCAAFYNTVRDNLDCIQGVEIIPAGNSRAMIVMLSVGGKIRSSVCRISCPVDSDFKKHFYRIISECFIGIPLGEVNQALLQSTAPLLGERLFDMLPVLTSLCALCREASESSLHIEGETNLLSHEELGADTFKLLSFLASKQQLLKLLEGYAGFGRERELFIGNENYHPDMKNTASMLGKFNYNEGQTAILGIIGSTRIDYASILPRVNYIMDTVKNFLRKGGIEFE